MKTFRFIAVMMFFAAFASISAFAQTGAAPGAQATVRVAIIDTTAFAEEKGGIQKFISAYKQLQTEFGPKQQDIKNTETRLQQIQTDLTKMQAESQKPNSPISAASVQKKLEEGQVLQTEYNRKVEDYKNSLQRREAAVVGPVYQDIGKAIQDYAKAKGYTAILDISKDQTGMIVGIDMATVDATTADFIKFYNARPAGTASTAK